MKLWMTGRGTVRSLDSLILGWFLTGSPAWAEAPSIFGDLRQPCFHVAEVWDLCPVCRSRMGL